MKTGRDLYSDRGLYRRLLLQAKPYWLHISGIFLLDLLQTPLILLTPIPLKIAVDSVIGSEPLPGYFADIVPADSWSKLTLLAFAALLLIAIAMASQLRGLASSVLRTYTAEHLMLDFRTRLFHHVQRLSLNYHDRTGTADSLYRIQYDATAVQYIAIDGVMPFITATFTLISMIYVTYRIDWELALIALLISPFLALIAQAYRGSLRRQSRQVKKLESATMAVIQEVLSALRVVKAFGQEDREQARFRRESQSSVGARIHFSLHESVLDLLLGLTTALGTALVLYVGVSNVLSGVLTLGALLLVMTYLAQLYSPLKTISRQIASLQGYLASAERAFALVDAAPDVEQPANAKSIQRARGDIELRNLSFSYEGRDLVLDNISLHVPAGTRVGIAGKTGAGKSTLMNLLLRFYDPCGGEILLDGTNLRDYRLQDLRKQFSMVLQDTILFSTNVAENIAYAQPTATLHEIEMAAKAANAHEFIMALPNGYETLVGERGMQLSGGERQRIALARAFLKEAPILILDEPTSSVDIKTENSIIEAMERLMRGRTTFLIAHRLSTLENCDQLLVLEHGRLVAVHSDVKATVQKAILTGELMGATQDAPADAHFEE